MLKIVFLAALASVVATRASVMPANNEETSPLDVEKRIEVIVKEEEVWAFPGSKSRLSCDYSMFPNDDAPVSVTWKVGDGPRYATNILRCSGYTRETRKCTSLDILDTQLGERMTIAENNIDLEITQTQITDNRNYWCQVGIENPSNTELETDAKSVVLRVYNGGERPKFHSTKIDSDFIASIGKNATIECTCGGGGYHCYDVAWYKGPRNDDNSLYEMIYTRTTFSRPTPTEHKVYGDWVDRVYPMGDSIIITGVQATDVGRYWCELRSSGYMGVGEYATDAKSVVMDVESNSVDVFDCDGKADGMYPDPVDCFKYYECSFGNTYHRPCPTGTVFDAATSSCKSENEVSTACGKSTIH